MGLRDIWDYMRAAGDRRLRTQGYISSGMGLLERYRRARPFWEPHLEQNRAELLRLAGQLGPARGGTLLILGAGRLLDVPWEELFPRFERVVLWDADACVVPYVERLVAAAKFTAAPELSFEIGDATGAVVDVAAWAEHTIAASDSAAGAARALSEGFTQAGVPRAPWTRTYADVRLAVSTNLLSQLGYFPRLHVQTEFRKRFGQAFREHEQAAESLECFFDRVRARHLADLADLRGAAVYLSTDVRIAVYALQPESGLTALHTLRQPPADGGVSLDNRGELRFAWPVELQSREDPLHGQRVEQLWPRGMSLEPPRRWAWHIVPQGLENRYIDCGRVHIVEAWSALHRKS